MELTRGYLSNGKNKSFNIIFGDKLKLDNIDIKILRLLAENSRISIVELASKAHTTIKIATTRIKRLVNEDALAFRILLNYQKTKINFFKLLISFKDTKEERLRSLLEKLHASKNIIFNLKVIGEWDLEPEFEFEDEDSFKIFVQNLLDEYKDIIKRISVINVVKEYKYPLFSK